MRASIWAAIATTATLSVGAINAANATSYNLDTSCVASFICGTGSSFGTVNVTGTSTALTYAFSVTNGIDANFLLTDVFMRVLGTVSSASISGFSGTVSGNGDSVGNGLFNWNYRLGDSSVSAGFLDFGLASGFTNGFDCGGLGAFSGSCGTSFTVTFNGAGLSAGTITQDGITMIAGAAVNCDGCANPIGASASAVPGPIAGAGLPGLVAACVALFGLARRRRRLAFAI